MFSFLENVSLLFLTSMKMCKWTTGAQVAIHHTFNYPFAHLFFECHDLYVSGFQFILFYSSMLWHIATATTHSIVAIIVVKIREFFCFSISGLLILIKYFMLLLLLLLLCFLINFFFLCFRLGGWLSFQLIASVLGN